MTSAICTAVPLIVADPLINLAVETEQAGPSVPAPGHKPAFSVLFLFNRILSPAVLCIMLCMSIGLLAGCGRTEPQEQYKIIIEEKSTDPYESRSTSGNELSGKGSDSRENTKGASTQASNPQASGHALDTEQADLCAGMVTHKDPVNVPQVGKPPYLRYYRDPAFGAKVIRISDTSVGDIRKPAYSTMQAWNADESLLLLYGQTNKKVEGHYLHDGKTYELIKQVPIRPRDLEEVWWSYTDPASLFYVSREEGKRGSFIKHNALDGSETALMDFTSMCGKSVPTAGADVQMHSYDDDVFAFCCGKGERYTAFTYRLSTGEITKTRIGTGSRWSHRLAPGIAPSGKRFLFDNTVVEVDLKSTVGQLDFDNNEHASIGKAWNGQDVFYRTTFAPSPAGCNGDMWQGVGHLIEYNMETGGCRPIITQGDGYPYTTKGTHLSATAYKRPGWVAMSSIGYDHFHNHEIKGRLAPPLFSEIYLVNTNPESKTVCRLAHHRSYAKEAENAAYTTYFGEPHATISPSGTRILFGSDWYASGSVDAYVVELPAYQP